MSNERCHLSDAILLDYITGTASDEIQAKIQQSPACIQAAQLLADDIKPLLPLVHRLSCPDIDTLIDFQERKVKGPEYLVVNHHIAKCPACQKELNTLNAIDQVSLRPESGPIRRLIEALFQPLTQLPQPLRGVMSGNMIYQTPQLLINISTRKTTGKPRRWTLRGQLRTSDGQLFKNVEDITLRHLKGAEAEEYKSKIVDGGFFVFKALNAGKYSLHILTQEEEILIREISIGDEL